MRAGHISIWFFIGFLFTLYGALILGGGIYYLFSTPAHAVVLGNLHAEIWWGAVLLFWGLVYIMRFAPRRK